MRHTSGTRTRVAAGFSLLEVMISILILALGLLGILAAYPSVIELQRRAQDDVLGQGAAAAAESYLRNVVWENEQPVENDGTFGPPGSAQFDPNSLRELLQFDTGISQVFNTYGGNATEIIYDYTWAWEPRWTRRNQNIPNDPDGFTIPQAVVDRGDLILGGGFDARVDPFVVGPNANSRLDYVTIPVSSRLFPEPGSGAEPRYVWDAVFRRVDIGLEQTSVVNPLLQDSVVVNTDVGNMPLQAAVFVRRIDAGIAVPPEVNGDDRFTRTEAIAGYFIETNGAGVNPGDPVPQEFRRVPVSGVKANIGQSYGAAGGTPLQPTNDGRVGGNRGYAPVVGLPAFVDPDGLQQYDVLEFSVTSLRGDATTELRRQAAKPRQILVDNTGGIREVVEVLGPDDNAGFVDNAPIRVRVDPPYSAGDALAGGVSQVVFTPQIPVAVRVVELRP